MNLNQKYRPTSFETVCGQTITTTILNKVIMNRSFKNCYLFSGKTGSGKTTCARIFAKAINNGVGEPIEIDAASNGGVDDIRNIIEDANKRDLVGEYKIFIIDECHMITLAGWNAFLKGIEEPPKYTIFIFCTTEPNKIPATILNRVQRYNFTPIPMDEICNRLKFICNNEGFTNYDATCDFISKTCFGSMRDAITTLEQAADFSTDLAIDNVKQALSGNSYETMFKLTWAIQDKKSEDIITIIDNLYNSGLDLKNFVNVYLDFIMDLSRYTMFNNIALTNIPSYLAAEQNPVVQYTVQAANGSATYYNDIADKLFELKQLIRYDQNMRSTVEIVLISLTK